MKQDALSSVGSILKILVLPVIHWTLLSRNPEHGHGLREPHFASSSGLAPLHTPAPQAVQRHGGSLGDPLVWCLYSTVWETQIQRTGVTRPRPHRESAEGWTDAQHP